MSDLLDIMSSAGSGGLFGLVGTGLGRIANYFENKQKYHHEVAVFAYQLDAQKLAMTQSMAEAQSKLDIAESEGRWKGLNASIQAEAAIGESYKWVNAIRSLTRPILTILLWGIASGVYYVTDMAGRQALLETISFAATAATLWWFGDRGPKTPPLLSSGALQNQHSA